MASLTGSFTHSIDDKNRIRIPTKFKDVLVGNLNEDDKSDEKKKFTLVFHRGTNECIEVYNQETVDKIIERFADVKHSDSKKYQAVRQYLANFEYVESDTQGRLVIPQNFKDHALIKKDIKINGMGNHIEIWSIENYEKYFVEEKLTDEELASILDI